MKNRTAWEYRNPNSYLESEPARSYFNTVLGSLNLSKKSVVLDIASGKGEEASFLKKYFGCKVFETDLQSGQREGSSKRNFAVSDVDNQPFPDASFDLIHCKDAFIHIPYKDKLFVEAYRLIKPGGDFLLTTQIRESCQNYLQLYNLGGNPDKKVFFGDPSDFESAQEFAKSISPRLTIGHPFFFADEQSIELMALESGFKVQSKAFWTPTNLEKNWSIEKRVIYKFKKNK